MTTYSLFRLTNEKCPGRFVLSYSSKGLSGCKKTLNQMFKVYNLYIANPDGIKKMDFFEIFTPETAIEEINIVLEKTFATEAEVDEYKKSLTKPNSTLPSTENNQDIFKNIAKQELEKLKKIADNYLKEMDNLENQLKEASKKHQEICLQMANFQNILAYQFK